MTNVSVSTDVSWAVRSGAAFGVTTVNCESLITLTFLPVTAWPGPDANFTALTEAVPPCSNPPPVTVTVVPPPAGPTFGVTDVTHTAALYWNAVETSAPATFTFADGGMN